MLFQPSKETGKEAYEMLKDKRFDQLKIDYILTLHNFPASGNDIHYDFPDELIETGINMFKTIINNFLNR